MMIQNVDLEAAIAFVRDNWDTPIEGSAGSDMIEVNRATMRTRINKGQAVACKDSVGRTRARVSFTAGQLIYNMVYDVLSCFGSEINHDVLRYTDRIREDMQAPGFCLKSGIAVIKRNGGVRFDWIDGQQGKDKPNIQVNIGKMVEDLALRLYSKRGLVDAGDITSK